MRGGVRRFVPARCGWLESYVDRDQPRTQRIAAAGDHDLWIGHAPSREEIDERIGNDEEARHLLFNWSMAEFVERYLADERLQSPILAKASLAPMPALLIPGLHPSASIIPRAGLAVCPGWGYVKGGMGMVSFFFCDAAREAGAMVAAGVPVAESCPAKACCSREANAFRLQWSSRTPTRW